MSVPLTQPVDLTPSEASPPVSFPYGWRYIFRTGADGQTEVIEVPLTLEDVLHPEEGDVIPERSIHERERGYLSGVCRTRQHRLDRPLILSDCIINWGIAGLRNHSPDVSVFTGLTKEFDLAKGTFRVREHGARCLLAAEIASPETRGNDVGPKLEHYHRAGVGLYVLIDQKKEGGPRELLAYRHAPGAFQQVALDHQGRLFIEELGLHLALRDNQLRCFDAETGHEFGHYAEVEEDRQEAVLAAHREAEARAATEASAQREAEARAAAEQRVRELEAELQRLRGPRTS